MPNYSVSSIRLDLGVLDDIRRTLTPKAENILDAGARKIEARWKGYATEKGVVDTGAYRSSVHVEPDHKPLERTITDGVEYGIYQELGHHNVPARPCATPAFEDERRPLQDAWWQLFEGRR